MLIEHLACAALERDSLRLRELTLEFLAAHADLELIPPPAFQDARLRALCEAESPEPLRKRFLYAPPNFLEFA